MDKTVRLKIKRQDGRDAASRWETFEIPYDEKMNVVSALMELRKNPVDTSGKQQTPPAWEAACLEEVCGTCTMYVNGMVRQSCTALIEEVAEEKNGVYEVTLEPMSKFPVVRDLVVDRTKMFEDLIKVKGWVPIDGSYDLGMGPKQDDDVRKYRYALSKCMTCGCCLEACPNYGENSDFIGPAAVGQTRLFDLHPIGSTLSDDRAEVMTSHEGITNCGNAQNCVKACPREVPLTKAIAEINRTSTMHKLRSWIGLGSNGS